jgi:hypothetical protein
MRILFSPDVKALGVVFPKPATLQQMAGEPCLFSCDWATALQQGGPFTAAILAKLDECGYVTEGAVIDVRVQRLMPGMYPSIPGWHCDGVPRDTYFAQPDFTKADKTMRHVTLIHSTADDWVSRTQFTEEAMSAELTPEAGMIYKQLHDQIEAYDTGRFQVEPGVAYAFSHFQPHRTMPTTTRGWRMFFRLSYYHNPPVANKIESVQQVYLLSEANGW